MYINKEEYLSLPDFNNREEAIDHFKSRSGNRFIVMYSKEIFDSHKIYLCYLILNNGDTQLITIHEDGLVKIEF